MEKLNLYKQRIHEIKQGNFFNFMTIPIENEHVELRIVDDSDETSELLLNWRNENWNWFETKFNGTKEKTKNWIKNDILKNPTRILFLIIYKNEKIGHIGLSNFNEVDNSIGLENFIRVSKKGPKNLMLKIMQSLFKWVFNELDLQSINAQLFSDNFWSGILCKKSGFEILDKIPLMKVITNDGWRWEPINDKSDKIERYRNIIKISKEQYNNIKKNN